MATTGNFISGYDSAGLLIENGDGTTLQDLIAPSGADIHIHAIVATTDDSSAVNLQLWNNDGTTDTLLTTKTVPAGAGMSDGVPAESLLDEAHLPTLDSSPGRFITLGDGEKLKIAPLATVTSAKTVWVTVYYGTF